MLGHAAFLYTSMRTDGSQNIIRPYHGKGNMVRPLIKGVQQTVARYSGRDWHHGLRRKIFHAGVGRVVSSKVKMREAMIKVQEIEMLSRKEKGSLKIVLHGATTEMWKKEYYNR